MVSKAAQRSRRMRASLVTAGFSTIPETSKLSEDRWVLIFQYMKGEAGHGLDPSRFDYGATATGLRG